MVFPLRFGLQTAQQRQSWSNLVESWELIEELNFETAWVFDHFISMYNGDEGECFEGWTTLAALAALSKKVRIGVIVTGNTYRNPVLLAKEAVTVDHISNGRLEFGIGAGWCEEEHRMYGFRFPSPGERVEMLDEALTLIRRLFTEERVTFHGKHYHVENAPFSPKPVQSHIPFFVGGKLPRMLGVIAKHADTWNMYATPEQFRSRGETLKAACRRIGRDPSTIRWSMAGGGHFLEDPTLFRDAVREYIRVGVTDFIFDLAPVPPERTLRIIATEIIPELRAEHAKAASSSST